MNQIMTTEASFWRLSKFLTRTSYRTFQPEVA